MSQYAVKGGGVILRCPYNHVLCGKSWSVARAWLVAALGSHRYTQAMVLPAQWDRSTYLIKSRKLNRLQLAYFPRGNLDILVDIFRYWNIL